MKRIALAILLLLLANPVFAQSNGGPAYGTNVSNVTGTLPVANGGTGASTLGGGLLPANTGQGNTETVTLSNVVGTSSTITNPTQYPFIPSGTTVDTAHFNYFCGAPTVATTTYPGYNAIASFQPTDINAFGEICSEFMVNTTAMELEFYSRGFTTSVEIDGQLIAASGGNTATAQAGGASTITLASGSSATNGFYQGQYIYIASGTGAGQAANQIEIGTSNLGIGSSGYNGTSKVATMAAAWGTQPDSTSVYTMSFSPKLSLYSPNNGNLYFPHFAFTGPRTSHLVRVYSSNPLLQINVDSSGTVWSPNTGSKPRMFLVDDSFGQTNAGDISTSYPAMMAKHLGFYPFFSNVGSTGIVNNDGGVKLTYAQRLIPPVNSWDINTGGATGSYTLTQGAITTGAINVGTSVANLQAAVDSAFGAGNFYANVPSSIGGNVGILIGVGTNAPVSTAMTLGTSSLVSPVFTPSITRYLGDIAPNLQKDKKGNALPCVIFAPGSVNDVGASGLQAAASSLYSGLAAAFPACTIVATGIKMSAGPQSGSQLTSEAQMEAAATASLPLVYGQSAFIKLFNSSTGVGYLNGSTNVTNPGGVAGVNTDACVANDGVHPTGVCDYFMDDLLTPQVNSVLTVHQ